MPDEFGGIEVEESPTVDEFGGQLVSETPRRPTMLPEVSAHPEEAGATYGLSQPLITIPRLEGADPRLQAFVSGLTGQPPSLPASESVAAAANVAKGLPEFMTSPLGIATAPIGAAGGLPAKLLGLGFAGQIGLGVGEAAREAGRASVEGTPQEKKEAALGLGSSIVLPGLLGAPALAEAGRFLRPAPPAAPVPLVAPVPKPAQVSEVRTVEPPAPPVTPSPTVQPLPAETGAPASVSPELRNKITPVYTELSAKLIKAQEKEATAKDLGNKDLIKQAEEERRAVENEMIERLGDTSPFTINTAVADRLASGTHEWVEGYGLRKKTGAAKAEPLAEFADKPAGEWFTFGQDVQKQSMAGKGPSLQIIAEQTALKVPDEAAWQAEADKVKADQKALLEELAKYPSQMMKRQNEIMGLGAKGQFFAEGLKIIRKEKAPEPAAAAAAAPAAAPAPAAPTYTGVDAQVVAGKPLGEWFTVKDAKELPKGEARALLARTIKVANQPAKILSALKNDQARIRKRVGEIYAPPAPEVAPVTPAAPAAPAPAPEAAPPAPKSAAPEEPPLPTKAIQNSISRALNAADVIGRETKKSTLEKALSTLNTHARKLGIPVESVGTYFSADKYREVAGKVRMAIGQKFGTHPTQEMREARDRAIAARAPKAKPVAPPAPAPAPAPRIIGSAVRLKDGRIIKSKPGESHTQAMKDAGVTRDQFSADARDIGFYTADQDFIGQYDLPKESIEAYDESKGAQAPPPQPAAPAVKLSESDMRDLVSDLTQLSRRSDLDVEERANVARAIEAARMGNPTEGLALRDRLKELAVPKTKLVKGIKFGGTGERIPDLIDWLKDAFPSGVKITSKSDYGRLVDEATGAAREVLFKNKGASVDTVMKAAELEGMHFASQDDFINAVLKAGSGRTETGARLSAEERMLQEEAAQVEEFQATALRNRGRTPAEKKAAKPFAVENLKQGDIFSIKGEQFKVREVTPEGDVITDDGKRFGQQQLRDGQTIYPDKGEVIETSEEGPGPIGMGGAAEGEIKPTGPRGEELPTYGVAARVLEKQRQAGTIIPVEPGEGVSPEEQIQRGRDLLAAGANAESIMSEMERTKKFNADEAAILRAHGELLDQAFFAASDKFGPNSPVAEKALEDYSAWQKRFKNLSTEWHRTGQTLQGETEIDTGTFHGLRKAWIDATGKDFTPEQAQEAKKKAKAVKDATEEADKAKTDTLAEVGKSAATETGKRPAAPKPGEVAVPDAPTIWKRAKELLDAGEDDFDSLRHKLAQEFGIPVEEVYRKLTEPKAVRTISDDMYRKMANRRRLVNDAKDWLRNEQSPGWLQFIRKVPRVFFTAKILGHGTVGMITHAGLNIFNPGAWRTYWPNFFRQYRLLASKAYHERTMQDLLRDPLFTKARRAGLANDPFRVSDDYQNPTFVKWLDRIGLTGGRGFDALKTFRQARFNQIWNSLPESLQTPGYAKLLADGINHATGAIRRPFREWANWTFFAPRLEASRWAWMVKDPWDAAKTFVDWEKATPEARAFAMSQLKEKAAIAGTYYGLLMMNQGLLEASGSDQRINFTNPRRGDFLAFKAAGHNIGIVGPMLGMVRLFANLYHAAAGKRGKVESLTPRAAEFGQIGLEYARGKLSPFAGFGMDVISQADFQGRPMPYSTDKTPKYLRRQGVGPYTYTEYALQGFTPIPFSEAVREVWRDQGMGDEQIEAWRKALLVGVAAGLTGARVSAESPPSPTK